MSRPCIAVSATFDENGKIKISPAYFSAIYAAGGICSVLDRDFGKIQSYAKEFDGFLFAGGDDIHPERYGEKLLFDSVSPEPERDEFELRLLDAVQNTKKPIFGICRGIQLINVALGGSLFQHIDGHMQAEPKTEQPHLAIIKPGSFLESVIGKGRISVNSFHHQSVNIPGKGLEICATSPDGGIEAIEFAGTGYNSRFLLGVQWHPELFFRTDDAAMRLFNAFIRASL